MIEKLAKVFITNKLMLFITTNFDIISFKDLTNLIRLWEKGWCFTKPNTCVYTCTCSLFAICDDNFRHGCVVLRKSWINNYIQVAMLGIINLCQWKQISAITGPAHLVLWFGSVCTSVEMLAPTAQKLTDSTTCHVLCQATCTHCQQM